MSRGSVITAGTIWENFKSNYISNANAGITWYDVAPVVYVRRVNPSLYPEKVFPDSILSGSSTYRTDPYPGSIISDAFRGSNIEAGTIIQFLLQEARQYTRLRFLKATFTVTGTGGNSGTHLPAEAVVGRTEFTHFNQTRKAHLGTQSGSFANITYNSPMTRDRIIYWSDITGLVSSLQSSYNTVIFSPLSEYNTRICHASCHSSCHRSRGRR